MGTWSVLFDISKVKQLNTMKNYIKIKEMRSDFLSKILTKSYLFAVHVYDGKKLFFLTNLPNCRFNLLHSHFCTEFY